MKGKKRKGRISKNPPSQESLKKQKRLTIVLVFISSMITLSLSVILMADADIVLSSNLSSEESNDLELVYIHLGEERTLRPSPKPQKIPKTSQLKYIRIYKNMTFSENVTRYEKKLKANETFSLSQKLENAYQLNASLNKTSQKHCSSYYSHKTKTHSIYDFVEDYHKVKNLTYSISINTNKEYTKTKIYIKNYFYDYFSYRGYREGNGTFNESPDKSIVYLNDTSEKKTQFEFYLYSYSYWQDHSVSYSITLSGYFWKDITLINQTKTIEMEYQNVVNVKSSVTIERNIYIFSSITNITTFLRFGSWIHMDSQIINHSIIVKEEIHSFEIDQSDLILGTLWGFKACHINVKSFNASTHEIDYDISYDEWYL